jgi:TolA-binding protein
MKEKGLRRALPTGTGRPAAMRSVAVAILGAALLVAGCDALDKAASQQYEAATKKWNSGDYRAAVQLYDAVAKEHPWSPKADNALYWSGLTRFLYLGETEKGLQTLRLALKKYPRRDMAPAAQYMIAQIYELGYNDYERAILEYRKAAEYTDRAVREKSLYSLGENLFRTGKIADAKAAWLMQVEEFPKGPHVEFGLFRLGTTSFSQGKLDEAESYYRRVLQTSTDADLVMKTKFSLANCLEAGDQLKEALALYRELAPQYPNRDALEIKIKALETRIAKKSY